ncbi:MAG: CIA30 family protein [Abditibacteriales bacterium]|nr:CIA30 family protein [Abditibacteriales bacterium]MDW8365378.1 hypothetical protein [Abditibacteriales bacterium]
MAQTLPRFDFTQPQTVQEWQPTHDVGSLKHTPEGMLIQITGNDPYITGPAQDYPAGQPLWMRIRLKSDQEGNGQVFYFTQGATEANSVRFPVKAGEWQEIRVPLPALGAGYRLRFDPPGIKGTCLLAFISFEPRVFWKEPAWQKPTPPTRTDNTLVVQSGDVRLIHSPNELGGFVLEAAGQPMAVGFNRPMIGYLQGNEPRWLALAEKAKVTVRAATVAARKQPAVVVEATATDADGARWEIRQRFTAADKPGAIDVETQVRVNQDRAVLFLPMFAVCPGVGSFGGEKTQGLFAGLEYLDNEPSSSEADIIGPGSKRQVPDSLKITFPLMAVAAQGRYVGLVWDMAPHFSALFDSPDRLFQSGGHVMGVLFPGSDGANRVEGNLLPYDAEKLPAGKPLTLRATLIGGKGQSVVPAIQYYVALRGLPPVPQVMEFQRYVRQAAGGWLDSKLREGNLYRHAYWPGSPFGPQRAADAAMLMDWLARQTNDAALAQRLSNAAREALAQMPPADYNFAGVSHVRYPVQALLYGHVAANVQRALEAGRGQLQRFEPDGSVHYRKAPDRPDFGKTHFAPDANGLTAAVVQSVLEAALLTGDPDLTKEGLRVLRALDKFTNTVPRGAQTWEVPLHTPDVLAAAHLVRAYTMGYEITGDKHFLDQAIYWAWTGVPFVYLVNPASKPIGLYASIPVFGATHWTHSWFGLPVQWCALVYADALYRLTRHDPNPVWKQLADGITASGVQQNWDLDEPDLQGLLPDSFNLRPQTRNGVAINPGTVQTNAVRLFNRPEIYDFRAFRSVGLWVHAPGAITNVVEWNGRVTFEVQGWVEHPYSILIVGCKKAPRVRIDGKEVALSEPHQFQAKEGRLILQVQGRPTVEVSME